MTWQNATTMKARILMFALKPIGKLLQVQRQQMFAGAQTSAIC